MSSNLPSIFPLEPSKFPYTKTTIGEKRNARAALGNQLFFDLVMTEVARISNPTKLYPPRNTADLRSLHDSIAQSPVDALKKQCCIYYVLQDWTDNIHDTYAAEQMIPLNYCALMNSYWFLDNGRYQDALEALVTPGLTPNFATKIMGTFAQVGRHDLVLSYVQTLQNPLDTVEKVTLYVDALVRTSVAGAVKYTRTVEEGRKDLFERVVEYAKTSKDGAKVLAAFPFDKQEEAWAHEILGRTPGIGLEALILRATMMGDVGTALKLREKHGGGNVDVNSAMRQTLHPVEQKLLDAAQ